VLRTPDAARLIVAPDAITCLDVAIARRHAVVPIALENGCLVLAARVPDDALLHEPVRAAIDASIELRWSEATRGFVDAALARVYRPAATLDELLAEPCEDHGGSGDDSARRVVPLVDALLVEACRSGASDLHLTPGAGGTRVRLRRDGRLAERARIGNTAHAALVQRIKVLATLDVAECRLPQDGRLLRLIGGDDVAFRVSSFPVEGGENVVLRVQDPGRRPASLAALGLQGAELDTLQRLLARPSGLLVVAGPVGSGKTTTLYALLGELDDGTRNLVTLEDPVEYPLDGVVQAAVDPARRIDFDSGARALLRQDPDVLMIGEIRDAATAEVALRAALAGHRVLATLHADDALAGIWRLLDLGIDAAALAGCLTGIVAQRLLPCATGGRFAVTETLAPDGVARGALALGGAQGLAEHDAGTGRRRFATVLREALLDARCERSAVQRVFGPEMLGRIDTAGGGATDAIRATDTVDDADGGRS